MDPRDLLDRLMRARGLNPHSLAAATHQRTKQPQIHRFLKGQAREPKRSTWAPVARFFNVSVEAFFDSIAADRAWEDFQSAERMTPGDPTFGGASIPQDMGAAHTIQHEDAPVTLSWEQIVSIETSLPTRFRLAVPDDSLSPSTPRGTVLFFSTEAIPEFGHGVLVETAGGERFIRKYAQGLNGRWIASANNPAYVNIHSEDGAKILAVVVARETGHV